MKKKYEIPEIQLIRLDNEISLTLDSNPPTGPEEVVINTQNKYCNPYHNIYT